MKMIKTNSSCFDLEIDFELNRKESRGYVAANAVNHAGEILPCYFSVKNLNRFIRQVKIAEQMKPE